MATDTRVDPRLQFPHVDFSHGIVAHLIQQNDALFASVVL
jgi:hypothetical protein